MADETKAGLSAPQEVASATTSQDMGGMSVSDFAALMAGQAAAERQKQAKPEEAEETESPDAVEENAAGDESATEATENAAEEAKDEGAEQPAEEATDAPEDEEVLSQSEPVTPDKYNRTVDKMRKRINDVTAKAKAAEEEKARLQAELEQLKSQPKQEATEPEASAPEPVVVHVDNPDDKTAAVLSEKDLEKVEQDARAALEFIEDNRAAILKAYAQDKDVVTIGDREIPVSQIVAAEKEAKRHLERYIPKRREFLKQRGESLEEAKKIFPTLFDKRSAEYQEFQSFKRQQPAINALPSAELWYGLAKIGLNEVLKQRQAKATPPNKPASATPPKTAGDAASASAPAPNKQQKAMGEKGKLKAELDRTKKEYESTGSQEAYARMLQVQSRLKKIT